MSVGLIAALAANGAIGVDGHLPWRLPRDLARFKRLTMGHALLMGRKTFDSIGRPLPGRTTVVVTRNPAWPAPPGVLVAASVAAGIAAATAATRAAAMAAGNPLADDGEVFVAGGAEIYRAALPLADLLHLTFVERDFPGDTFFPAVDWARWRLVEDEPHAAGDGAPFAYRFATYERGEPTPGGI